MGYSNIKAQKILNFFAKGALMIRDGAPVKWSIEKRIM